MLEYLNISVTAAKPSDQPEITYLLYFNCNLLENPGKYEWKWRTIIYNQSLKIF